MHCITRIPPCFLFCLICYRHAPLEVYGKVTHLTVRSSVPCIRRTCAILRSSQGVACINVTVCIRKLMFLFCLGICVNRTSFGKVIFYNNVKTVYLSGNTHSHQR